MKAPENRQVTGQFQKGKSGNPGGRPKEDADLKELARARTADALGTLVEVMQNADSPPAARVSAACAILDRGYGKPTQSTELTGKDGGPVQTSHVSDDELARWLAFEVMESVVANGGGNSATH